MSAETPDVPKRPGWIDELSHVYAKRGKGLVLLTGATKDLFWNPRTTKFLPLEQSLYQALSEVFTIVRYDTATGITFFDEGDRTKLLQACAMWDTIAPSSGEKLGDVGAKFNRTQHEPLPSLVLLSSITKAIAKLRRGANKKKYKPVCVLIQHAGALLPNKEFDQLNERDRQMVVQFLSWLQDPTAVRGDNLVTLIADNRSEVNSKILTLPGSQTIEIDLPNREERLHFATDFANEVSGRGDDAELRFEHGDVASFVDDTAGLPLYSIADLLEVAVRSAEPVTRSSVLNEVNLKLESQLSGIIKVLSPGHTVDDVIGFENAKRILGQVFRRCDNPETAVSSLLVSGPNGCGKTFLLEALAAQSGRIPIELTGLRGMYYGQTDRLFEKLRWQIRTYGKILILVDEADTAFGSVSGSDTHQTEKRLSGGIIKLMGDPTLRGKVLWALMTARPHLVEADVKSRCPIQTPLFDLEGQERKDFVKALFARKKIELSDDVVKDIVGEATEHYSLRDFSFLISEVLGWSGEHQDKDAWYLEPEANHSEDEIRVLATLDSWQASTSIVEDRALQRLIAAQHCSYPGLLPEDLRDKTPADLQGMVRQQLLLMAA